MLHIAEAAREEIVRGAHRVSLAQEGVAQMRPYEASSTRHQRATVTHIF
jgi:hypothetical protein